tara:strand:- start:135 stop:407 length:273 start_codon:yes stop_codon:yes gene_type:complete
MTQYVAILRSAPYRDPHRDKWVCKGDIVQVKDIKEDRLISVPEHGTFDIGDTVFVEWDIKIGMRRILYETFLTDDSNTHGGFYYLDGTQT